MCITFHPHFKSILYKLNLQLSHESYFPFSQEDIITTKFFKNSPHNLFDVGNSPAAVYSLFLLSPGKRRTFFHREKKMFPKG